MQDQMTIENNVVVSCTATDHEVTVPDGVVRIGKGAFKGCASIKKIKLPDSVQVIEEHAFKGCRQLEGIRLPKKLIRIGDYAFHRCHSLKSIELPETIEELGNCVFLYCDQLEIVKMQGVKRFGKQTFLNDTAIREIYISGDVDCNTINECFTGCHSIKNIYITENEKVNCYNLDRVVEIISGKEVTHPIVESIVRDINLILEIEDGVLTEYRNNVKHVTIPEGITGIGKSCFFDKRGIQSVVFPKSLMRIGARAFRACMSLEKVIFTSEEVEIEEDAFLNCSALRYVELPGERRYELSGLEELADEKTPKLVRQIHHQLLANFVISGGMLLKYRGCENKVIVPQGVTVIGQRAFAGNENIDRIELPQGVQIIEREAFADCVVMQSIELPDTIQKLEASAFENCVKLIHVKLPQSVKTIPKSCFKRCMALQEVILSNDMNRVEDMAFYGCRRLNGVTLPDTLAYMGDMAFYGCERLENVHFPSQITSFGRLVFQKCTKLEDIPDYQISTEKKAQDIFDGVYHENDSNVINLVIPDGTKKIDAFAFFANESLENLILPESLEEIGEAAFYGCKNLRNIHFPKHMILLGESCFEKCISLSEIEVITKCLQKRCFAWCGHLEKLVMYGVERIEKEAFQGCKALDDINLKGIKYIGINAFQYCESLTELSLYQDVLADERAFAMCGNLRTLTLYGMVHLGDFCFEDCGNLKQISVYDNMDQKDDRDAHKIDGPDMASSAFRGCTGLESMTGNQTSYLLDGYKSLSDQHIPVWVKKIYASACSVYDINVRNELTAYSGYASKVTIPNGITAIAGEVFRDREGLREAVIAESVSYIGARAFDKTEWLRQRRKKNPFVIERGILLDAYECSGEVVIPQEVDRISGWAFANNLKLTAIRFTKHVEIEEFAFRNCIYLQKVILEDGSAYTLGSLKNIDHLPPFIQKIARECYNCFKMEEEVLAESTGNIEHLQLPFGISVIGKGVFKDSNLLTDLRLNGEIKMIEDEAMYQCKWLKHIENTGSIERIGVRAFSGCIHLESVGSLEGLKELGARAFENCCSLKEITLPEGIKEIPDRAFYRCIALEHIKIPSTVESIADSAFLYCNAEIETAKLPES